MIAAVLVLVLVLVLSAGLVEVIRRWFLRREIVDVPSDRSSHEIPVVRGAGAAVAAALAIGWTLEGSDLANLPGWAGLPVAAFGFAAIGFIEDLWRDRPVLVRLGLQVLVGGLAGAFLLDDAGHELLTFLALTAAAAVWLVAVVNLSNFMDGINGLAALTAIAAGLSIATMGAVDEPGSSALTAIAVVLSAALAGFLPHNFPVARVFLGDSGSYLVGAALAGLVVLGARAGLPLVALAAPLVPYLGDASITLVRRIARGERWWEPHREHAYQRLITVNGWSHARSTMAMATATALAGLAGILAVRGTDKLWVAVGGAAIATAGYLALPVLAARLPSASIDAPGPREEA